MHGMWGILENAPDAMLVVDRQGLVVFANALCGQLFGKPVDAITGRPLAELLPERSRGAHEGHLQRTFEKSERRAMGVGLTLSGLKADGTEFPAEVSISHMEGHAVAAVRDVSERLRASHRLATLGVLVAGVAHEDRKSVV
jgi:PAS domain S-box-containing protein